MVNLPQQAWRELKKELMSKWHELKESELDRTLGDRQSIINLLEEKVGLAFEEASRKFSEMSSRYHLYEEPQEEKPPSPPRKERILEINPRKKDRNSQPRRPIR